MKMTSTILMASPGWKPIGPRKIQSRAPFTSRPNRKVITSSSVPASAQVYL